MKQLFQRLSTEELPTLSVEMIDLQINDYVVGAITDCFKELTTFIKDNDIAVTYNLFNSRDGYAIIKKLDAIISKRFGISLKHTASTIVGYGILVTPPKNYSNINKDIELIYKDTVSYLKNNGIKEGTALPADEIRNGDYNYMDKLYNWKKSMDALDKTLNTTGVIVDLRKAYIHGLPEDYKVLLSADFCKLILDLELTPEELTAALLHEIGHAFTHIEYSYRIITNTSVIMDTIKDGVEKQNKSYKESLLIAYKKVFNENPPPELEKANTISVVLATTERFIKENNYVNKSRVASTDSEQLADQFAGRFGLGAELITGLNKIHMAYPEMSWYTPILLVGLMQLFYGFTIGMLLGVSALGILTAVGIQIIIFGSIFIIATIISSYLTGGNIAVDKTYDDNKQRLIRIRNEVIRNIRSSKLDTDTIKNLLEQIDSMSLLIDTLPDKSIPVFDKIFQTFTTKGKAMLELKTLDQLTESLMENDLHTASARLKLMY